MLFSSLIFLYAFLPCTLLAYFLTPRRGKNPVLLLASLLFYAWGEPRYLILILLNILLGFTAGLGIHRFRGRSFALYVALFPQLIAGPIVRYRDVAQELQERKHSTAMAYEGACRFLVGLGKKVILANNLGLLCQSYRSSADPTVLFAWLSALGFFLQIYYDFSGYSDMAIGLGRILGFHFPENFRYPYCSRSVTEFWRRWHMTLGAWFRDYVYIPLGGNRTGKLRWMGNILLVWCLTGLWHGAGWNFLLWGLFYAILLLGEKLWYGPFLAKMPWFSHIYLLLSVLLGFVLFQGGSLEQSWGDFRAMLGAGSIPTVSRESLYALRNHGVLLILGALGATPLPGRLYRRWSKGLQWIEPLLLALLLLLCTAYLVDGSFNPFLYFRF